MGDKRIAVATCVHDDHWFLKESLESFRGAGDLFAFVSRVPWNGECGDWAKSVEQAERAGAKVVVGEWPAEILHRQGSIQWLLDAGYTHVVFPDSDEVASKELVNNLVKVAESGLAQRVYVHMDTYWRHPDCVIRPREKLTPLLMVEAAKVHPQKVPSYNGRLFQGGTSLLLTPEHGVLHHLSYVGPEERIKRKIETWSHVGELLGGWFEGVYQGWERDRTKRNLHPTHEWVYGFAERIERPEELTGVPDYLEGVTAKFEAARPNDWPKVSVVIPLYGGEADIAFCLKQLEGCHDLLHEVVVVDDVSPDKAADVAESFGFARVVRRESNGGFAKACNQGVGLTSADLVLLLNSDAGLTRPALVRMVETYMSDASIGAVGPLSDNIGYFQKTEPPMTDLGNLERTAGDYACREVKGFDVSMLVGFCLILSRAEYDTLGGLDESFGVGLFEDTDLCYRLQRAGKRLVVCPRAFVYHKGSQSLERSPVDPHRLLKSNGDRFRSKWADDLACGFASHLAGDRKEPVVFDQSRRPDRIRAGLDELAKKAKVSLCMIVRDEERVIRECLESVQGVFSQIVVVDTGSKDRTKEIVREFGAELYEMEWPMSFAAARNKSLKHATGDWIFWMDADDTLPRQTALAVLSAASSCPENLIGFVVPVRFVDPIGSGTQVDHVKLFRRLPGVQFEGRIHEQILASLRQHPGDIGRLNEVVLHTGYDTSEAGQAKKRVRDKTLLQLDLKERPGHPFVLFNIGMTEHFLENHVQAIEWLDRCIQVSQSDESHIRKAFALKGVSLRKLGEEKLAVGVFSEGLKKVGSDPELLFQRAISFTNLEMFSEARLDYEAIDEQTPNYFSSFDVGILSYKKYFNLGTVCLRMGDYVAARRHLIHSNDLDPSFTHGVFDLFNISMHRCDFRTAGECESRIRRAEGCSERWADMFASIADESGRDTVAEFQKLMHAAPTNHKIALAYARYMLSTGRTSEVQGLLTRLGKAGVPEAPFYMGIEAIRRADWGSALGHMQEAHRLDPSRKETLAQIDFIHQQQKENS